MEYLACGTLAGYRPQRGGCFVNDFSSRQRFSARHPRASEMQRISNAIKKGAETILSR